MLAIAPSDTSNQSLKISPIDKSKTSSGVSVPCEAVPLE